MTTKTPASVPHLELQDVERLAPFLALLDHQANEHHGHITHPPFRYASPLILFWESSIGGHARRWRFAVSGALRRGNPHPQLVERNAIRGLSFALFFFFF